MKRMQLAVTLAFVLALLFTQAALAHERRAIGKYQFVVGFLNEPAYLNQPNSIDLRVTNTETTKPVEGLEKTVKAEVIVGGKTMPLVLTARFGQPGAYIGNLVPTQPGTYIFHLTGNVEGITLDEKFESGPGRFGDVEETTALQFPVKISAPQDMSAQLQNAQSSAANAQMLALVGIGFGVLGLIVGGLALRRK